MTSAEQPVLQQPHLVLASQSAARRQLLAQLQLSFSVHAADLDETPLPGETATALVERLAIAKAQAVATHYPNALIIGADEVGVLDQTILGKPADPQHALAQLQYMNGREVEFVTGLCVINTRTQHQQHSVERFFVRLRKLSTEQLKAYLRRAQPFSCAASLRIEGLGMALCAASRGDDPTSLLGLPLLRLVEFLAEEAVFIL